MNSALPRLRWVRRSRLAAAALMAIALAAGCSSLGEWERKAIFSPTQGEQRWHREPLAGTETFDLKVGEQTVRAWYTPAISADAPTVLYLHGARWNLNGSVFRIERWVEMGFNVLAIDYRGFGASSEILPSEDSARADTRAALTELKRRQPDPARRYLYGHSLGGALAIDLAAERGADEFAAVVVESTFTSIPAVVQEMKWGWIPGIQLAIRQRFDSINKVAKIEAPLLIVHGTADGLVPPAMADELFAAAASPVKRLVKFEGVGHSGVSRHPGYADAVMSFLFATLAGGTTLSAAGSPARQP
ncbi:MAG: alpha/beta fold hydrolase [Burkholderiaceae bacterium]